VVGGGKHPQLVFNGGTNKRNGEEKVGHARKKKTREHPRATEAGRCRCGPPKKKEVADERSHINPEKEKAD